MPAKDLGTKHTCFKCGTKFYDLKKAEPLCPKCGADQRESPALKPAPAERRQRAPARPAAPAVEEAETEVVDDDLEADAGDVDDDEDAADDEP
jgi:uncharacterized protein (TIGR02300 family)